MRLAVPPGASYAVVWRDDDQIAWCASLDVVVELMHAGDLALRCEVVRVAGDVCVWPLLGKKGEA